MAVNKVIYDGATLVDLTGDTVTADNLAAGVKATGADGKPVVGLLPKVTIDSALSASSTNPVQNKVITAALNSKVESSELKAVAKSGSYNDLSDKPTIPAEYTLPYATNSVLGGVKVGVGLYITADGVLSVPVRKLTGTDDGNGNVTLRLMADGNDVLTATDDGNGNIALATD